MDTLRRDYLEEAYDIINGRTRILPERMHLLALRAKIDDTVVQLLDDLQIVINDIERLRGD